MSTEWDYLIWSPPAGYATTYHRSITGESCWKTVFRKYNCYNGEYIRGIEFDLDGDGLTDTFFYENYVAKAGPVDNVGTTMYVVIHNT